jgi:hypothetical protein
MRRGGLLVVPFHEDVVHNILVNVLNKISPQQETRCGQGGLAIPCGQGGLAIPCAGLPNNFSVQLIVVHALPRVSPPVPVLSAVS